MFRVNARHAQDSNLLSERLSADEHRADVHLSGYILHISDSAGRRKRRQLMRHLQSDHNSEHVDASGEFVNDSGNLHHYRDRPVTSEWSLSTEALDDSLHCDSARTFDEQYVAGPDQSGNYF